MAAPKTKGLLAGRVAVITGAAGGIGSAASRLFASEGARLLLTDRSPAPARERAPFFLADLAQAAEVQALFLEVLDRYGRLDVLFNVAGISGRRFGDGPVDECTEGGWDAVMAANVKSMYLCCRFAIPAMRHSGGGSIVNLGSVTGLIGSSPHFATHAYAASKAAVVGLTRAMAAHYARDRIRVNCVCPGLTETPMSARAQSDKELLRWTGDRQRLTGPLIRPEAVAQAALFLASDRASAVTGVVLPVDGGWLSS